MNRFADASRVSGADFFAQVFGITPEQRQAERQREVERCIAAINRGDTYGWPPVMVAACRQIMAEREGILQLEARQLPDGSWSVAA
jgi:hypothetical protein